MGVLDLLMDDVKRCEPPACAAFHLLPLNPIRANGMSILELKKD